MNESHDSALHSKRPPASLLDDIIDDLRHFADPYSDIDRREVDCRTCVVSWTSRRRGLSATLIANETPRIEFNGTQMTYGQFLAHEELGNLSYLAENTIRQFESAKRTPSGIVTTAIRQISHAEAAAAHDVIDSAVAKHDHNGTTHVVFLAAQGGAGKTKVLERLVHDGAKRFAAGGAPFLYFYVNAQGRALARVDEAFAVELDLLGAHLSFSAIAALTRAGVLVPVIDGFDELIGAVGYDEAFQSLGRFLDTLRGAGQLVAAARSTYYEREFQARVRQRPQKDNWSLDTVTLQPWGVTQRLEAVNFVTEERRADGDSTSEEAVCRARQQLGAKASSIADLLGRPFFAVQAARVIVAGEDDNIEDQRNLLRHLTEALLRREVTEKFLDRNLNPLTTLEQIWAFFREVASELWYQQTRSLDAPSLNAVVSIATDRWQPLAVDRLRERMRDLPIFALDGERVRFGHEYFFGLFLADIFRTAIANGGYELENALGRGLMPEGVAGQVALEANDLDQAFAKLNEVAASEALKSALIRENAGTLAAALLCAQHGPVTAICAKGMVFGNVELAGNIHRFDCVGCTLRGTDLTHLVVSEGDWHTTRLELAVVLPGTTELRVSGLAVGDNVRGLAIRTDEREDIWDPVRLTATLRDLHAVLPEPTSRSVDSEVVRVVERLARAFLKSVFVATEDDVNAGFMRSRAWPRVLVALERHELLVAERRATSGRGKIFYRCQMNPDELMAGLSPNAIVDARVRAFWEELSLLT